MIAAIDIGSNTILLLIAKYEQGRLDVLHEEQRFPRLGKGVDRDGRLSRSAIEDAVRCMKEYKEIINKDYPEVESIIVTATSAVRDASNRDEFKARIKEKTGLELRILSGLEEARWTYLGATGSVPREAHGQNIVIDIGGGSTELAHGIGSRLLDYHSIDIGSVRFTERYFKEDPPSEKEILRCRDAIQEAFRDRKVALKSNFNAVGVAGTVTSLAYMDSGNASYDPGELNGYRLSIVAVSEWAERLSRTSSDQLLKRHPVVMEGRADVFLAGVMILEEFMKEYEAEELIVSRGGIRHGAIFENFSQ